MIKRPKSQRLPGMEDNRIDSLHDAASEYAEIRDQRIELNQREIKLKDKLLKLMHKLDRTTYACDGVSVALVMEEETVKVKIKKPDPDELTSSVSAGGPKHIALPPDGDGKVQQPAETPDEKEAFDGDPRASAAAEKANHYPAIAKKRSERGKHLRQPVVSSKSGKNAPAAS